MFQLANIIISSFEQSGPRMLRLKLNLQGPAGPVGPGSPPPPGPPGRPMGPVVPVAPGGPGGPIAGGAAVTPINDTTHFIR